MTEAIEGGVGAEVHVVDATLGRDSPCAVCGTALMRGGRARVGVDGNLARFVVCRACVPPSAATMAPAALPLAAAPLSRGSLAVWITVGLLGAAALVGSPTTRRVLVTAWAGVKAGIAMLWARLRGRRGDAPAILRRTFEELGPTYVKLGQLIASSQGLFPEAYCVEFRRCLDRVKPFAFSDVQRTLREELGRPAEAMELPGGRVGPPDPERLRALGPQYGIEFAPPGTTAQDIDTLPA